MLNIFSPILYFARSICIHKKAVFTARSARRLNTTHTNSPLCSCVIMWVGWHYYVVQPVCSMRVARDIYLRGLDRVTFYSVLVTLQGFLQRADTHIQRSAWGLHVIIRISFTANNREQPTALDAEKYTRPIVCPVGCICPRPSLLRTQNDVATAGARPPGHPRCNGQGFLHINLQYTTTIEL